MLWTVLVFAGALIVAVAAICADAHHGRLMPAGAVADPGLVERLRYVVVLGLVLTVVGLFGVLGGAR